MGEENYIMTVGFLEAEFNQIWNDEERYEWSEFDYKLLQAKEDSKSELLMGIFWGDFSVMNTLKTDVIFAILSTPIVGLIAKNQTILATDIIRRIPGWIFGLASLITCMFRINAIIENNMELLQQNYNAVKMLEFLDKLPRFDEFKYTEYFVNMIKSDRGVLEVLNFEVVEEFYKFRNKESVLVG